MAQRWRMTFHDGMGEAITSLWCQVTDTEAVLEHDYPDFYPQSGWRLTRRGRTWEVVAVDGRRLALKEV